MGLSGLPVNYIEWLPVRESHLEENLKASKYTFDLFKQYKKHLGWLRYEILIESQKLVVPKQVKKMLYISDFSLLSIAVPFYKFSRKLKLDKFIKSMLLPSEYKIQINGLDLQKT